MSFDGYGWYLSSTAALLYLSWIVHNLVAWLKVKPFLTKTASRIFIGTMSLTVAPIILQIVNNFLFFNNINDLYVKVRPYEVLMRFVTLSAGSGHVLSSTQRSMVDICLHSVLLYHQNTIYRIYPRTYQRTPPLRYHAVGHGFFHHFHNRRCSLEHHTQFDCG
jgi:hypothetical protein